MLTVIFMMTLFALSLWVLRTAGSWFGHTKPRPQ
jgi:hypothetical protein